MFTSEERLILRKHDAAMRYRYDQKLVLREHEKILGIEADMEWPSHDKEPSSPLLKHAL